LFENDLAHRCKVCISTASKITNAWIPFLRRQFEPLITIPGCQDELASVGASQHF